MYKTDVFAHFGGKKAAVSKLLGISRAAVGQWPDIVPEGSAYKLQALTDGALKVNPDLYAKVKSVA